MVSLTYCIFLASFHALVFGRSISPSFQVPQNDTSNDVVLWFFGQHIQDFDQDLVRPCQIQPELSETCWCYQPSADVFEFTERFNDIQLDRVQPKQFCEFGKSRLRKWFMRKSYTRKFTDALGRDWVYCNFFIRVWGGKSFFNVEATHV